MERQQARESRSWIARVLAGLLPALVVVLGLPSMAQAAVAAACINDATVTEGNSGTTVTATFSVTMCQGNAGSVTVNWATQDGTAAAPADYTTANGVVTVSKNTPKTVSVTVKGDNLDENDEVFFVNLSGGSIASGKGVGTITDDDASPSVSINDITIPEGNTGTSNASFTVTLSTASGRSVSVDYATADGTATQPGDYASATGTVTFPAGSTSQPIQVVASGDTKDEPDETFFVNLSTPSGATISDGQGVATITDDDNPPGISINDVTVAEGNAGTTNATFTVSLAAASGKAVSVNYATSNGTATQPADYTSTSGALNFPAGVTSQQVVVPVKGDTLDEADETFNVDLSGATNASISDAQGVGAIADDDAAPGLSINDATVSEGDAGTVNATFTVSLAAVSGRTVTVDYVTTDGTATAPGDYASESGTLTFSPGQTTKSVVVAVNGDALNEADEAFTVDLSAASNASVSDAQGTGTITDDDPLPAISVGDVSVAEGDSGTTNASFTVTLAPASGRTVSVDYATADGTATSPDDYTATSGTLTFAPGQTTKQVDVPVVGETAAELDEAFELDLTNASHATIGDAQGVGTITDNDPDPSISIANVSVPEGDAGTTQATFTVSLSASSFKQITVDYATADGSAASPDDYASTSGTLTFAPGETIKKVNVDVNGDTVHEGDEAFTVALTNAAHASISDADGTGTIVDNDKVVTSLSAKALKKKGSIVAGGTMLNAQVGFKVSVKLQRKKGSKYVSGLTRTATIKSVVDSNSDGVMEGRFATKFKMPTKGSYRFLVTFAGDANDLPATTTASFKV